MKRDMDLARAILFQLEAEPTCDGAPVELELPGRSQEEVVYHTLLLHEAGLIEAHKSDSEHAIMCWPIRLTWDGHEFLEAARDESRWNKAKQIMKSKTEGMVFAVLQALLVRMTTGAVFDS